MVPGRLPQIDLEGKVNVVASIICGIAEQGTNVLHSQSNSGESGIKGSSHRLGGERVNRGSQALKSSFPLGQTRSLQIGKKEGDAGCSFRKVNVPGGLEFAALEIRRKRAF